MEEETKKQRKAGGSGLGSARGASGAQGIMSAKRKAEALIPAEESDQLLIRPL